MRRVSTIWLWESAATMGMAAYAAAATSPARSPAQRRTAAYIRATVATAASTCGIRIAQFDQPKIRTERACTWNASGSLSMVIDCAVSCVPHKKADQSVDME